MALCACGGGGEPASRDSSVNHVAASEYYPFTVGHALYATYQMVDGRWDGARIAATKGDYLGASRVDHAMYNECAGTKQPAYVSAFHDSLADGQPINWKNQVSDGYFTNLGKPYIGEVYQQYGHPNPDDNGNGQGEAKITINPVVGEVLTGSAVLYTDCSDSTVAGRVPWVYRTVSINGDLLETSLHEVESKGVYRYTWRKGCGLIELAWGDLHDDGSVTGRIAEFECTK
jgi:hypothetical protein